MHMDTLARGQFADQFIQSNLTLGRNLPREPIPKPCQLAVPAAVALKARRDRARLSTQLHQIVHEFRRNPKMTRRLAMAMTFIDKGDHPCAQLYRMWLAHTRPPISASRLGNHSQRNLGTTNLNGRNTL